MIQKEIGSMLKAMEGLTESIRKLVCDRRLPENSRLMEIRATNRDLQELSEKIGRINAHFLTAYNLKPLESPDKE